MADPTLKNFLELTYEQLEAINLKARSLKDPVKAKTRHVR